MHDTSLVSLLGECTNRAETNIAEVAKLRTCDATAVTELSAEKNVSNTTNDGDDRANTVEDAGVPQSLSLLSYLK